MFNKYFIDTNKMNKDTINTCKDKNFTNSIFINPAILNDIIRIILTLKNTQSEGFDSVSTKIIKACREELSPILTHLVNISIASGVFPDELKIAIVKPLHKKGDKTINLTVTDLLR